MGHSKPLSKIDESGDSFVQEMLNGNPTFAINFDRLQFDKKQNTYIIFEFQLCEENQVVTPFSSHPNRYWYKNSQKFISLWKATQKLDAVLYMVNYAKRGTRHSNEVLVIKVLDLNQDGIRSEEQMKFSREKFGEWFRDRNNRCA